MPIVVLGGSGGIGNVIPSTLPAPVTNFVASASSAGINLSWNNPTSYFTGVMIRAKPDSAPTSITDGLQIYVGAANSFLFKPPADGTYYFRAYPFNSDNQYQTVTNGQIVSAKYVTYPVYGVRIDTTNPDPQACCVYTDDAVGMSPSLGNNGNFIDNGWDNTPIYSSLRPCLLKNGQVVGYLQKNNFNLFEDGTTADLSPASMNDVMIEIPTMAYMIYTEGDYIYVKITNSPDATSIDSRFVYYAHQTPDIDGNYGNSLYISAYDGYIYNNILRSIPNVTPTDKVSTTSATYSTFQSYANNHGSGYSMLSFYPFTLLQCLYLIRYKNLNSQIALGNGISSGPPLNTGNAVNLGMNYGANSATLPVKCNGIENMWGNVYTIVDGVRTDSNYNILTSFGNFNRYPDGYQVVGNFSYKNTGFITKIGGDNYTGFIPRNTTGGSNTTYYCDMGAISSNAYVQVCGGPSGSYNNGIFCFVLNLTPSSKYSDVGTRLQYIKNVK